MKTTNKYHPRKVHAANQIATHINNILRQKIKRPNPTNEIDEEYEKLFALKCKFFTKHKIDNNVSGLCLWSSKRATAIATKWLDLFLRGV